jgi:GT2 family glycosyltransferase
MKDLSVIIVNYRGGERLKRCLESLKLIENSHFTYEVIVVDNQSNKGRLADYKLLYPEFSFISNAGNQGFASGCNLGAAKSTGSVLMFLNPVTSVTAEALFDMLEEVRVGPKCSIISYRKLQEEGTNRLPDSYSSKQPKLNGWLQMISHVFYGHYENSMVQERHHAYPDWIFGSAFMIGRDGFLEMGKLDEDFWVFFEDDDLYNKDKSDFSEIVKLKNGVIGHTYRGSSNIIPKSQVMVRAEIQGAPALSVLNSNMVYESPSWF